MALGNVKNTKESDQNGENPLVKHMYDNSVFYLSISNEQLDSLTESRNFSSKELFYLFFGAFLGVVPSVIQAVSELSDYKSLSAKAFLYSIFIVVYGAFIITGAILTAYFYFKDKKRKDNLVETIRKQTEPRMVMPIPKSTELFRMMKKNL